MPITSSMPIAIAITIAIAIAMPSSIWNSTMKLNLNQPFWLNRLEHFEIRVITSEQPAEAVFQHDCRNVRIVNAFAAQVISSDQFPEALCRGIGFIQ